MTARAETVAVRTSSTTESVGEVIVAGPDDSDENDKDDNRGTHLSVHSMRATNRTSETIVNALNPITFLLHKRALQLTEYL